MSPVCGYGPFAIVAVVVFDFWAVLPLRDFDSFLGGDGVANN